MKVLDFYCLIRTFLCIFLCLILIGGNSLMAHSDDTPENITGSFPVTITNIVPPNPVCAGDYFSFSVDACIDPTLPFPPSGLTLTFTFPVGFTVFGGGGSTNLPLIVNPLFPHIGRVSLQASDFTPCFRVPIIVLTSATQGNGTYVGVPSVSGTNVCIDPNSSPMPDMVVAHPLTITKTASTLNPMRGATFTYSMEVCNPSMTASSNVFVRDILDPAFAFASSFDFNEVSPGVFETSIFTLPPAISPTTPSCTTLTMDVMVVAEACTAYTNCASVFHGPCSATSCVDVVPWDADYVISGPNLNSSNFPIPPTASTVLIDGQFIIDNIYLIQGKNVTLTPGSNILLTPALGTPSRLEILHSHLHGCDSMWGGILVDGNGDTELIVRSGSIIEDMQCGIVSRNGGRFEITGSFLDKNLRHIFVDQFAGAHNGFISGSTLSCSGTFLPYDLAVNAGCFGWLPTTLSTRTAVGIQIDQVEAITIGQGNIFDNADIGIEIRESNVTIANNEFSNLHTGVRAENSEVQIFTSIFDNMTFGNDLYQSDVVVTNSSYTNMVDLGTLTPTAAAIRAEGPLIVPTTFNTLSVENSTLTGCNYGIFVQDHYHTEIRNNTLSNMVSGIHIGNINARGGYNVDVIEGNTIEDMFLGGISIINRSYGNTFIRQQNELVNTGFWGILLQSNLPTTSINAGFLDIVSENTIVEAQVGIKVSGYSNIHVNSNIVSTDPGIGPFGGGRMTGYDFANNVNLQAHYNTSTNNTTNSNHRGFFNQLNSVMAMSCNEAELTGHGFMFDGLNAFSSFVGNSIQDSYTGLTLQNNGEIGHQPDQGAIPLGTNENEWDGSFGFAQTYTRNGSYGPDSWFYVSTPLGTTMHPTLNLTDQLGWEIQFSQRNPPDLQDCEPPNNLQLRMATYEAIVDGSYPTSESNLLMYQYTLYHLLEMDSVSVDSSLVISAFYDSAKQSVIGQFYQVDSLIDAGDLGNAALLNGGIASPHLIEQNLQHFNQIWLTYQLNQQTAFTTDQIDSLEVLAFQCPAEGGPAVIRARATLENRFILTYEEESPWYEFPDDCEISSERTVNPLPIPQGIADQLTPYPNPTAGRLNLRYPLGADDLSVKIVDLFGRKLRSLALDQELTAMSIDLSNIPEGMYLIIWQQGNKVLKSDKIMVTK